MAECSASAARSAVGCLLLLATVPVRLDPQPAGYIDTRPAGSETLGPVIVMPGVILGDQFPLLVGHQRDSGHELGDSLLRKEDGAEIRDHGGPDADAVGPSRMAQVEAGDRRPQPDPVLVIAIGHAQ